MRHPEQGDPFIGVVVGIDEQDDVGFADLLVQGGSVLGQGRGVDDGGGDIAVVGGPDVGREGDGRQGRLNPGGDEDIFDQGCDEAGFPGAFVAAKANTDRYYRRWLGISISHVLCCASL